MIGIIDYNVGNLASVYNACTRLNEKTSIVKNPNDLKKYSKIILPGVGAFKVAIENLIQTGMKEAVLDFAKSGKFLIGICLGMQLLFESSEEFGYTEGLGLIDGKVIKFDKDKMPDEFKIPHMGWNKMFCEGNGLFKGLDNPYLYFVHSYHAVTNQKNVIGTTHYGYEFTSAVNKNNIFGFQPHPEKSHNNGLTILKNFMELK